MFVSPEANDVTIGEESKRTLHDTCQNSRASNRPYA